MDYSFKISNVSDKENWIFILDNTDYYSSESFVILVKKIGDLYKGK